MSAKPKAKHKIQPQAKVSAGRVKKTVREGFFKKNSFAIGLFLITFVVFFNGIGNEYALDDEFYTAGGNKLTQKGIHGIKDIFKSHTFFNNDGSGYDYRPVALTTFAIEKQFFGEDPHVSHFFNLLLYALTVVLIFTILRKWFVAQGNWFSFFICLLFLVHPLHTEVVDNIKCRDELLAMLFILLTTWSIWKHIETKKWIFLFLYPVFFMAGMLSKQTVIPFFAIIPLALWFFTNADDWNWKNEKIIKWVSFIVLLLFIGILIVSRKPVIGFLVLGAFVFLWFYNARFWKIAIYIAPLLVITFLATFFEKHGLATDTRTYLSFENPLASHPGFAILSATSFYVVGKYLFLHFIPYPLVYYYGSFYVPTVSWSNPIAIVSLIIHLALGIWAIKEFRKKSILGFGLLFYLINIAAYSNFLKPAPGIMAERYTYASSLGFSIVIVFLIFQFMKIEPVSFRWKVAEFKRVRLLILSVALLFAARSFWRTGDWKDKKTLYGHDMEYLQESVKANMLYGALISKDALEAKMQSHVTGGKGEAQINQQKEQESIRLFSEARGYYQKAATMAPYYQTAWSNLGTAYFFTGETKVALSYFLKAIKIKPDYAEGWFNVGMAYDKLQMNDSAVFAFSQSIKSDSTYVTSYEQYSRLIMQNENNPEKALELLRTAARHKPDSEVPWNNMANIYLQLKDTANSAGAMEMAAVINPNNVQRLYNLAQYFRIHGNATKYNYYMSLAEEGRAKKQKLEKENQDDN